MKKFLLYTAFYLVLVSIPCIYILSRANGFSDPYYERFTTPSQSSMVIGTSRSAQGILPEILNKDLGRKDVYNYSFTISNSPYGPIYLKSIEQKLDKNSKNGIFILAVDPWSISSTGSNPNDESQFIENTSFLADLNTVSANPNIEYLLKHYTNNYFKLLYKGENITFLHDDGWLEVKIDNKDFIEQNTKKKLFDYRNNTLPKNKFSEKRLEYLKKTVNRLQAHGKVYLVRLPVHVEMMKIENILMHDFDARIKALSNFEGVPYLNLTPLNSQFQYTDGNHLHRGSGRKVTKLIAAWLKNERIK